MMDGAYFTGRKEILEWINDTLEIGITKIEQTCTGAIACQLLDAHLPGNVQMNKLNWEAKSDHEVGAGRAHRAKSLGAYEL
jgi:RP/EB family microtubule-associated protein